jgi:hypothetical protein
VGDTGGFLEATDGGNHTCGAGEYKIWANTTDTAWKKCENGTTSDLDIDTNTVFDATAHGTTTWGSGSDFNWTIDVTGATDQVIQFTEDMVTFTEDISATGRIETETSIRIREDGGGQNFGTLNVEAITGSQTYTFGGTGGTVWTSGNSGDFTIEDITPTLTLKDTDGATTAAFTTIDITDSADSTRAQLMLLVDALYLNGVDGVNLRYNGSTKLTTETTRVKIDDMLNLVPSATPPDTCDAGDAGSIYHDTSPALCWCDGTTWQVLSGTSCS